MVLEVYSRLTALVAIMISAMTMTASKPMRKSSKPCMKCDSSKRSTLPRHLQENPLMLTY